MKTKILTGLKWIALIICIILPFFPYNWWFNGRNVFSIFHCINVSATESLSYGELGDFVGGLLGTIIAGIACFYVYKTYISQKEELEKTRRTAEKQQFETTFFNLIHIHKENLEAILYNSPYIKQSVDIITATSLWDAYENNKLEIEDYERYFAEKQLQGEQAICSEFNRLRPIEELEYFEKYFYSGWFNCIYQTIKYLRKYNNDKFYVEFFYSQITRPEWWVLYDIFLNGENFISDKKALDDFIELTETELVKERKMFFYGFCYISEKYDVNQDNLYDKTVKHEKRKKL